MGWQPSPGKIRTLLGNSDVKVSELQGAFGVSSASYYGFMKKSGATQGVQSDCCYGAMKYFEKREIAGLKMPRKKKVNTE
jgi:hypothetical protein